MTPARLASLCAATMPEERLTADELTAVCFGDGDEIVEHEHGAAVFTVKEFGAFTGAWLLLVAVEPDWQRRGIGEALARAVIERARARGASDLFLGFVAPRYVWPAVDVMNTAAGALVEKVGFDWTDTGLNMAIPTSFRGARPDGVVIERETRARASAFAARHYAHWVDELDHSVAKGTTFAARSGGETIGFACHSVWRAGWIGPMATEPVRQHNGVGSALLGVLCEDLAERGLATGEICWVSNLRFYGKCGATVSRAFRNGHLKL